MFLKEVSYLHLFDKKNMVHSKIPSVKLLTILSVYMSPHSECYNTASVLKLMR